MDLSESGIKERYMSRDHSLQRGSVKGLWTAHRNFKAIVVIVGPNCKRFPYRFDEKFKFIVLGLYAVTHIWGESRSFLYASVS